MSNTKCIRLGGGGGGRESRMSNTKCIRQAGVLIIQFHRVRPHLNHTIRVGPHLNHTIPQSWATP